MLEAPFGTTEELLSTCPLPLPEHMRVSGFAHCLVAVAPMIQRARERVRRCAQQLLNSCPHRLFDPASIEESLAANVVESLLMMMTRVMVLELNVARLEGLLAGDTPEERFVSFLDRLRQPEVANQLLDEYPVMADQIANRLDKWSAFSLEFLGHLCADWDLLRESIFSTDPGTLAKVQGTAGDTHRSGRSVVVASFSGGERIVYKPRSLAVDEHFQELLAWLNSCGAQPEFRLLRSLNRGDHGWAEFVSAVPCATVAEVSRFYQRQGSHLAVLYALNASDFHYENLIAAGEHPVLTDLEALFHPRFDDAASDRAEELAGAALGYSALRVGLLPHRIWANEDHPGVDISGLSNAAGQLSPRVPQWERVDTDEMHLVRKRMKMRGAQNCPSLPGQEVNAFDYVEEIAAGFVSMYRLLLSHRAWLLTILNRFSEDEVRVIVRPTQIYGTLLHESFHPDVLRKEADRLALFDCLQDAAPEGSAANRLIPAERSDLLRGDIPLFTTRPGSRDLWTGSNERMENYFAEPGISLAERRIVQLSDKDLEQQLWIVRASIVTLASDVEGPKTRTSCAGSSQRTEATPAELVSAACEIGDRLAELAVSGNDEATWIGLVSPDQREWCLSPVGSDLYDGLPGLILFLAYLGRVSDDSRYSALARAALKTMRRQIEESRASHGIGAFNGWGGIIYSLVHLGAIQGDPSLFAEAEELLAPIQELIEHDKDLDIVGGAAGCALALRSLHTCEPSARTIDVARGCGEHLLRAARQEAQGTGWACGSNAESSLTGFAHGNAGIACALLELAELTGEPQFAKTAFQAFDYERSVFSPEHGNWPDLRNRSTVGFVTAWCHGAPGIGLSRLCSLRHVNSLLINAEIDAALANTLGRGFGGSHTLCHGDLGNADILLHAAEILNEPRWRLHGNRVVAAVIESARETGWICGNPLGVESPGLMTGLAGIGYTFLRFADPARIPSILALEPPALT